MFRSDFDRLRQSRNDAIIRSGIVMQTLELQTQTREKNIVAAGSVLGAIILTALKIVVGILTSSLGILAEAAHSSLDLAAALITLFAVRISDRPADNTHLYGHGKVENLSALAETILLLVTSGWVISEAIQRLFFRTVEVDASIWAFLTMGISIAIDYTRSRALSRVAKKYNSQALEADALHFSTDIWSSTVVILGLALVALGDRLGTTSDPIGRTILTHADALSALGVALIVIYVSIQLGRRTVDALLDRAPEGLVEKISAAAENARGVMRVIDARVREAGNQVFIELSVAVPRYLSFEESHAVTGEVQNAVRVIAPNADVVVHAVPRAENEGVLEKILAIAARGHYSVHNITTHSTATGMWVDLDLEVDPGLSFERSHALATDLETALRKGLAETRKIADVNVHIEPRDQVLTRGVEFSPHERGEYIEWIETIQRDVAQTQGVQDIALQKMNGKIYLSCHLLIDRACPIAKVHHIAEEMEIRLRRELPQLGRVVIHTEPFIGNANP